MPVTLIAQEKYGLEFASKGIDPDARTAVNLFPGKPFSVKNAFSLSFDLSFIPNADSYFGYVFLMTDEKEQHIDLVYNVPNASFDLVVGNEYCGISIKMLPEQFSHDWHSLRLDVNSRQHTVALSMNGKLIRKAHIPLNTGYSWKIYFGANRYESSKTFDLPPMRAKDIRIFRDDRLVHHWPLHQYRGNSDTDIVGKQTALIDNPVWLAYIYRNWQQSAGFTTMGNASVAFDSENGMLYIGGRDSLYYYDCTKQTLKGDKLNVPRGLPAGNQSVFGGQHLYNFLTDLKKVSVYDPQHHTWDSDPDHDSVTKYWHANRFYAPFDSAIYIVGGYGYYHYTNQVQRYSLRHHTWETLTIGGDNYTPRYMAALGTTVKGDSAFIIGGYGSVTGDQLLNPHNLYDLNLFDVKSRKFHKIYQLPQPKQPFAFGNSMVVDTKTQSYYALTFNNDRMQSSLQLIKGSLKHPTYTKLADNIPFRYFDIRSRAELFYYAKGEKLIAVTLYTPENHVTVVSVYTVLFPPALLTSPAHQPAPARHLILWLTALSGVALCGVLLFKLFRFLQAPAPVPVTKVVTTLPAAAPTPVLMTVSRETISPEISAGPSRSAILLFGEFTVIDKDGNNISKLFSPLVKELFLLLLLHSIPDKKGITSEKINETLWPGRPAKDAKNNRSVNIVKLKNILDRLGDYTIEKDVDKWVIHFDSEEVYIDLLQYFRLSAGKDLATIEQLTKITGRGGLLSTTEYNWLDKFKSDLSSEITAQFLQSLEGRNGTPSPGLTIAVANSILNFDALSEDAVMFKCRALVALKQHTAAKAIYNSFVKEYAATYGETYEKEYQEILVDE